MTGQNIPRILCVDDEPKNLDTLRQYLREGYDVHCAINGHDALEKLRQLRQVAVLVTDMRMPGMDGARLLREVTDQYPTVTRILMTGNPSRDSAMSALASGEIFRFVTKPCVADNVKRAVDAGVIHHRLQKAERDVLEQTVVGCISALIDGLAIASPVAFGRVSAIKRLAVGFASWIELNDCWQLEAAAMLSQIGYLTLPAALIEKLHRGEQLSLEEQQAAYDVSKIAVRLFQHIPRLEPVLQIMRALTLNDEQIMELGDGAIGISTRILALALNYDTLTMQGRNGHLAIQTLRSRATRYGETLIELFAQYVGASSGEQEVREVPLHALQSGMTVTHDVRTATGTFLLPRGFEVTPAFLERLRNGALDSLAEKVQVLVALPDKGLAG
jgi:CheY-like chemotaxis protein